MGRRALSDQSGATAIEYALIATLVAVSCIVAFALLGTNVSGTMNKTSDTLESGVASTQQAGAMGKE